MRQLAVLLPLVGACADQGAILAEKERLALRVSELEAENKRLDRENDRLHAEVRRLKDAAAAADRASAAAAAKEKLALKPGQTLAARLHTSKGTIRCTLWPETAPIAVLNFVELAEGRRTWTDPDEGGETTRPLYNGTIFHRVIPGFMIQGGDPMGTGEGGPGYTFVDETSPEVVFDRPGLLAMANAGPDTNGSQFFITDRATPRHLDGKHTIFGLCQDLDVVEAIATVERDRDDRPREPIVLQRVTIERK